MGGFLNIISLASDEKGKAGFGCTKVANEAR
jgi:hypothetical protein